MGMITVRDDPRHEEMGDQDQQSILDAFFAANLCDLDALFARPLRSAGVTAETLIQRIGDMLEAIGQFAQGTNMGLERLLSLIKCSAPSVGRRHSSAERIWAAGTLTQVMQRHLAAGHSDFRGHMRRSSLKKLGVRIRVVKRRRSRASQSWHLRYASWKLNEHPERAHDRSLFAREWKTLTGEQQTAFKARYALERAVVEDGDDEEEDDNLEVLTHAHVSAWQQYIGNGELPISPESLEVMLEAAPGAKAYSRGARFGFRGGGVRNRTKGVRNANRSSLLVKDVGSIPVGMEIQNESSCIELHYGLCVTDDQTCYTDCLVVAAAIRKFFGKSLEGEFYRWRGTFKASTRRVRVELTHGLYEEKNI
jgi:hypothetical protein